MSRMQTPQQNQPMMSPMNNLNRVRPVVNRVAGPNMKHEWFDKTVRSAARVNSNLSYTLTQLNKAQAAADSIEALAVVHNKLQEILSNSINSLIQIRKNLRTEFIAGIKTIRFPPKPAPETSKDDDDVILVSPGPSTATAAPVAATATAPATITAPPATVVNNSASTPPCPPLVVTQFRPMLPKMPRLAPLTPSSPGPSGVSLDNKSSAAESSPKPESSSTSNDGGPPKVYLKVRSFSQLQTLPAECITIPDDPPAPKEVAPKVPEKVAEPVAEKEDDDDVKVVNEGRGNTPILIEDEDVDMQSDFHYNIKDDPDETVKKMMSVKIDLKRSETIDEMVRQRFIASIKKEKESDVK